MDIDKLSHYTTQEFAQLLNTLSTYQKGRVCNILKKAEKEFEIVHFESNQAKQLRSSEDAEAYLQAFEKWLSDLWDLKERTTQALQNVKGATQ